MQCPYCINKHYTVDCGCLECGYISINSELDNLLHTKMYTVIALDSLINLRQHKLVTYEYTYTELDNLLQIEAQLSLDLIDIEISIKAQNQGF